MAPSSWASLPPPILPIRLCWASPVAQQVKNLPSMQEIKTTQVQSLDQEDPLEEENGNPLQYSCLENPMDKGAWQATIQRGTKSWTQLSDYIREGNGTPLQYSCLENPMDRGAWWAAVRGVAKSWTRLSDFTFTFHFHAWEKEMATHSSVLAWRIPGTVEPGGLLSMGSHRVRHNWSDLAVRVLSEAFKNITIYQKLADF